MFPGILAMRSVVVSIRFIFESFASIDSKRYLPHTFPLVASPSTSARTYFDGSDSQSCRSQQHADAASSDSFAQSTDHTTRHEDVFHSVPHLVSWLDATHVHVLCHKCDKLASPPKGSRIVAGGKGPKRWAIQTVLERSEHWLVGHGGSRKFATAHKRMPSHRNMHGRELRRCPSLKTSMEKVKAESTRRDCVQGMLPKECMGNTWPPSMFQGTRRHA